MTHKTYRITQKANSNLYIPSWLTSDKAILDTWLDIDASTEEQAISEYLIDASAADSFERLLDDSPTIIQWEEITGNWPKHI